MDEEDKLKTPLLNQADEVHHESAASAVTLSSNSMETLMTADIEKGSAENASKIEQFFNEGVKPQTRTGTSVTSVEHPKTPARLCCFLKFYPTKAIITIMDKNGKKAQYLWNSRDHRKMRFPLSLDQVDKKEQNLITNLHHPKDFFQRFHLLSWQPHNVTWYNCWIGGIANTLWVINGVYAVWPELARGANGAVNITYWTGVIGAFMFIITGYLGYVESINHTHNDIRIPAFGDNSGGDDKSMTCADPNERKNQHKILHYGLHHNALGSKLETDEKSKQIKNIIAKGYPVVQDCDTGLYLSTRSYARTLEKFNGDTDAMSQAFMGRDLKLRLGNAVVKVQVESIQNAESDAAGFERPETPGYVWWMKHPDIRNIGVFNAIVFFVSTIIFWIPALAWLPMGTLGSPDLASTIFWVYILQMIPSVGFIYVGHAAMAEAAGSWVKPNFSSIGWWISLFNTVGGYGFLLYPILSLPMEVGEPGCCDSLYKWGAAMATFWGSCAFWIAGLLQCVEFSSEHPITLSTGGLERGKKEK